MDFVYDYKEDEGYDADAVAEMDTDELKTYLKHRYDMVKLNRQWAQKAIEEEAKALAEEESKKAKKITRVAIPIAIPISTDETPEQSAQLNADYLQRVREAIATNKQVASMKAFKKEISKGNDIIPLEKISKKQFMALSDEDKKARLMYQDANDATIFRNLNKTMKKAKNEDTLKFMTLREKLEKMTVLHLKDLCNIHNKYNHITLTGLRKHEYIDALLKFYINDVDAPYDMNAKRNTIRLYTDKEIQGYEHERIEDFKRPRKPKTPIINTIDNLLSNVPAIPPKKGKPIKKLIGPSVMPVAYHKKQVELKKKQEEREFDEYLKTKIPKQTRIKGLGDLDYEPPEELRRFDKIIPFKTVIKDDGGGFKKLRNL